MFHESNCFLFLKKYTIFNTKVIASAKVTVIHAPSMERNFGSISSPANMNTIPLLKEAIMEILDFSIAW